MKIKILMVIFAILLIIPVACGNPKNSTTQVPLTSALPSTDLLQPPTSAMLSEQGFDDPNMPRITVEALKKMFDDKQYPILIDTRSKYLYDIEHIWGARSIPNDSLGIATETATAVVPGTTDKPAGAAAIAQYLLLPRDVLIVFYCDCPDDNESVRAVATLLSLNAGFDPNNVKVLWKGIAAWDEISGPVVG